MSARDAKLTDVAFTFLMLGEAEVAIPARHKHHVIGQVFALNLQLLHYDNICLEDVEHGIERPLFAPWLVAERIADAIDIPGRDAHHDARLGWE